MTKRSKWTAAGVALLMGLTGGALQAQQLKNENLLVGMPQGFKLGFKDSKNGMNMQEFIPAAETVQNWTEMVTVQVFLSRKDIEPAKFLGAMQQQWAGSCKDSTATPVATGKVNGYDAASILLRCPMLASTGKPEAALIKAIKGNDSFYVVQRAVRSVPSADRLETMKKYIDSVSVCDSRLPTRACPTIK
jgi:hypothetical protein